MKQKTGRKLLSFLLTLAMLVGLMPGMSLTAYAATSHGITINTAQHGTVTASVNGSAATSAEEGATVTLTANPDNGYRLKSISGVYKDYYNESMGIGSSTTGSSANFSFSAEQCNYNGCRLYQGKKITISSSTKTITRVVFTVSGNGNSRNESQLVTSSGTKTVSGTGAGSTITISNLSTNSVSLTGNGSNNAQQWQCNRVVVYGQDISDTTLKVNNTSDPNIRTFTMPAVVQGNVTITAEFEEMPKYKVTLTGGANATTSGGNTTQTELTGAMETVTYTANSGFHFTEFANITNNGITATRTSDTAVTVSGTPTADASITIPDAVADAVAVTGVTLNPSAAQTIDVDGTVSFTATVLPDNATDKTVKWSVGGTDMGAVKLYSDEACTTEVGADATDKLTVYAEGISAGSATITATSNADSEKKASCDVTVNAAQTQTETLLTTITATGKEQASYSTENVATVSFSYTANGYSSYLNNGKANWGWWGYGLSATVNAAEGYTITKCVFYDDKDRTATDSEAPFVVETTEEDKTPKVNGTPILAYQSKGIKKIEVYGYATPTATHSVTITAGDHMTKTAGSGDAEQTGLTGAMTDVVYTANEGYYFPTDYSVTTVNGISVTRNSYTQITVSGTPTADATITLTAPTEKDNQSVPETTGFSVTNATNATSADGVISGVTSAMEYSLDGTAWTAVTGTTITGLNPGSVQIRLAGDDTHNASDAVTVAVSDQLADAKTAAKADLDTLLAGKTESNYDADDWTALNQAITDGKDNIDAATTIDEVTTAKTNAVTAVNAIKTKAEKLADAKTDAKADLDTLLDGKTEADYDADDWIALNQAITDGKTAIENATTTDAVATAKNTAVDAVNAVKTKAQKLADAKTTAKNDLDALLDGKNPDDYDQADWDALTQAINDAKTAIDAATTLDAIEAAKTPAQNTADNTKTKEQKAAEALQAAKTSAKADLDALLDGKNPDDYDQADWNALTQAINDAKTAIDAATTLDAVEAAKTPAQQAEANTKTKEQKAAEALQNAKDNAKADLDTLQSGKNQNDYDEADWTTLTQAITDGKTAIDNATTTEAITTAKNNAVDAVNAVKTKAQKELDNAKTSAVNTVNAVNANDYIAADQQTVTDAKTTALAAIEAATTEEEVTTALNNFNNAIASCTTQVVADQIAQVMSEVYAKTGSDMTYTGSPIQLINTPTTALPAGYTMKYAVTTENVKPTDENLYTTSIPAKTDAGTYNVYFKVSGNNNYNDYEGSATVTISKKPVAANISADDKTYDGKTDATVSASVKPEDLVSGDSIEITGLTGNFIDANAGEDKKVTVDSSAKQISGTGSDNYEVSIPEETTASITHLITEVKEVPATCTETGKKQHWKDEEGTLYKDAEGKETATEAELVIPALEHDWNNPTYEWAEDNSTVTATRTCKNDASHIETETAKTTSKVTKDATETEEGETTYTATFKNPAFTEQTKTESISKLEPEEEVTYSNTKGNGTQWTKGSTSTADFTFKRSKNDSETFSHFTGIQVDGKDVAASNYTAEAGSVIVKLKSAYLETLSVGEHTLTALFDDGNNASAKFTIAAKKASGNSNTTNSTTKKANTVSSTGAPKTGDTSNMLLWFTILCASVLVLFNVVTIRRRNTMGRRR